MRYINLHFTYLLTSCTLLSRLKFSAMFLRRLVFWPSADIRAENFTEIAPGEPLCRAV